VGKKEKRKKTGVVCLGEKRRLVSLKHKGRRGSGSSSVGVLRSQLGGRERMVRKGLRLEKEEGRVGKGGGGTNTQQRRNPGV